VGGLLRLGVVLAALRDPSIPVKGDDYLALGRRLLESGQYDGTLFPPVYPALCASFVFLGGSAPLVAALAWQLMAGLVAIFLAARLASRFGGERGGVVAAWLVAVDPLLVVGAGFVLSEDTYVALALGALLAFERGWGGGERLRGAPLLLSGLLAGLATLTRSVGVLFLLALLLGALLLPGAARARRVVASGLLAAGFLAVLAPWSLRNLARWGDLRPTSSGSYNFAALVVGPARARVEGVRAEADLAVWAADLGPPRVGENPYELADRARAIAFRWALSHPGAVAAEIGRSQLRLWASPGRSDFAALAGLSIDRLPKGVVLPLVGWRILFAAAVAVAAFRLGFRGGEPGRALLLLGGAIVALHALAAGSAGYGRFLRPIVPFAAILVAGGARSAEPRLR
jgi:4-amino-4-deoxy-L-arabinose transferase-like glycosyltransferase